MASMAVSAIVNAGAFIGGSYLAKHLAGNSESDIAKEKERHDHALEKYQTDMAAWEKQQKALQDWLSENYQNKLIADKNFSQTDGAFKLYAAAHQQQQIHKPTFNYRPSEKQKQAELIYAGVGGLALGGAIAYLL